MIPCERRSPLKNELCPDAGSISPLWKTMQANRVDPNGYFARNGGETWRVMEIRPITDPKTREKNTWFHFHTDTDDYPTRAEVEEILKEVTGLNPKLCPVPNAVVPAGWDDKRLTEYGWFVLLELDTTKGDEAYRLTKEKYKKYLG